MSDEGLVCSKGEGGVMQQTICDKCGKEVGSEDVRYLGISKFTDGKEIPSMPTLEICTVCSTALETIIRQYDA